MAGPAPERRAAPAPADPMHIQVQFWGVTARLSGSSERTLVLAPSATVADAAAALGHCPELNRELKRCAFAVGDELVPRTHRLQDGDTLAVLPPVSGG